MGIYQPQWGYNRDFIGQTHLSQKDGNQAKFNTLQPFCVPFFVPVPQVSLPSPDPVLPKSHHFRLPKLTESFEAQNLQLASLQTQQLFLAGVSNIFLSCHGPIGQ